MKIAIPLFGNWISPRFGFSPEMWIITVKDGKVLTDQRISMGGLAVPQWFHQLASLDVDTLICGGIDSFCCHQLKNIGIFVIPEVVGDAGEILELYLQGKLEPGLRMCAISGRGQKGKRGLFFGPPWERNEEEK